MSLISDERVEELLLNEKLKDAQIERFKALCAKAADALERVDKNWPNEWYGADAKLIAQLRKAAK